MAEIVVVGSINADLTVGVARHPHPGETLLGTGGGISAGGKGANQAVAAARLGSSVAMVGAVGDDTNAEDATALLKEAGVDLSGVIIGTEVTGLAVITVAEDGENTIIVVPGANGEMGAGAVEKQKALIETAELVLLQGEIPADGFKRSVELSRGRVVINLAPVIDVDQDVLLRADPLVVNEHEAAGVLEMLGHASPDDPQKQLDALMQAGFASVVITLGADGALVAADGMSEKIDSPRVQAVDTVGAGDAFTGALCHQLVHGADIVDAARFAAKVGAFSVTRHGAQASYPLAGEL
ncbi:ribokinase [Corynebacterium genitalium ATCC 33030]|uniref:Ribokinase n=1 Tax=Corynebacterium genitalium ATCC 33030 TaxID=585529 RepID=D7WCA2_9CORY|nr:MULTISPECIES: ribokinase [Corynebacterium]MCQ4618402.1 ribokinase [Corynebacterium pseudogenitalium]EFK54731.1 putative ribokinase [Corynebacterium genitalium ATCC 33030]MCQ4621087.1 ribokinase [Corynebacterium sp. CCUG 71335]MCQ4623174.1 ribokinase [Corynebacterium sp. CCUG 70398]MCQ4625476.1 ribokinase [Corynebacterium sp. CCUG 69979]